MFPNLELQVPFKGIFSFPKFLREFVDGKHIFTVDDFPASKSLLQEMGVTEITISYKIAGSDPVIKLLNRAPTNVPSPIVDCWLW